jgi:hypothetical protein
MVHAQARELAREVSNRNFECKNFECEKDSRGSPAEFVVALH